MSEPNPPAKTPQTAASKPGPIEESSSVASPSSPILNRRWPNLPPARVVTPLSIDGGHSISADDGPSLLYRPNSNLSDRSFSISSRKTLRGTTGDILNPLGAELAPTGEDVSSTLRSLPLVFAILPALAGVLFQNGGTVVADVLLLGVACVILRWTVTQPWQWYRSAQETRLIKEVDLENALDVDSEDEAEVVKGRVQDAAADKASPNGHTEGAASQAHARTKSSRDSERQESALRHLYWHEAVALLFTFIAPMLGAYLLHTIRSSLSRPSEGVVSDFNISIFLLAAELHPISHALRLVRARTLHLQKIVTADALRSQLGISNGPRPADAATAQLLNAMASRLDAMENRLPANAGYANGEAGIHGIQQASKADNATLIREVRNTIQPEIDALTRAVRRYEKKATLLTFQTEARLKDLDMRINEAVSLAAAAAKTSNTQDRGPWYHFVLLMIWCVEKVVIVLTWPVMTLIGIVTFPYRAAMAVLPARLTGVVTPEMAEEAKRELRRQNYGRSGSERSRDRGFKRAYAAA